MFADLPSRGAWAALGALGALSVATPFLARAFGLEVDVSRETEMADHVVPGAIASGAVAVAGWNPHRRGEFDPVLVLCASLTLLAGLFQLTTHVPLLADAADGQVPWDATIFMSLAGPPMLAISIVLLATLLRRGESE